MNGSEKFPPVRGVLGEIAAHASMVSGLVYAQEQNYELDEFGVAWPGRAECFATMTLQSDFYPKLLHLVRDLCGGGVIQMLSQAACVVPGQDIGWHAKRAQRAPLVHGTVDGAPRPDRIPVRGFRSAQRYEHGRDRFGAGGQPATTISKSVSRRFSPEPAKSKARGRASPAGDEMVMPVP